MVCSFASFPYQVETLFHEFGHALNSLLSRTEFQHLSGVLRSIWLSKRQGLLLRLCALPAQHAAWSSRLPPGLAEDCCLAGLLLHAAQTAQPQPTPLPSLPCFQPAGTRGPPDMVEVPSHTLELFATDPRVLALFARHRASGDPLPSAALAQLGASRHRFVALDQQQQVGPLR